MKLVSNIIKQNQNYSTLALAPSIHLKPESVSVIQEQTLMSGHGIPFLALWLTPSTVIYEQKSFIMILLSMKQIGLQTNGHVVRDYVRKFKIV